MGKHRFAVNLPEHKTIDLSITLISLLSFIFNFAFPHMVLASNIDKNKAIAFDLSSKVEPYSFVSGQNADSAKEYGQIKLLPIESNKVSYKASAVITADYKKKADIDAEGFMFSEYVAQDRFANAEKDAALAAGEGKVVFKRWATITAYSSTPDQTDSTPFITAANTHVRDGVVAANFLPFGTRIRIPSVYSDRIFIVEDRMNIKHDLGVDIWFPTRQAALNFGVKWAEIEVVGLL